PTPARANPAPSPAWSTARRRESNRRDSRRECTELTCHCKVPAQLDAVIHLIPPPPFLPEQFREYRPPSLAVHRAAAAPRSAPPSPPVCRTRAPRLRHATKCRRPGSRLRPQSQTAGSTPGWSAARREYRLAAACRIHAVRARYRPARSPRPDCLQSRAARHLAQEWALAPLPPPP